MAREDFLQKVREKYPEYQDVPDDQLAEGILKKYPEYANDLQSTPSIPAAPTEEEKFAQQFTQQAQRPALQRAVDIAQIGPNVLSSLVGTLVKGAQGAEKMGENAVQTAIQNAVINQLSGSQLPTNPVGIAAGDVAQTGLEAGGRIGFDILNAPRQLGQAVPDLAANITSAILNNPGAISGGLPLLTALGRQALTPRTPSESEISQAFQRQLANQPFEEARAQPIAPEIFGTANIPAAEAIPIAAGLVEAAPLAAGLASRVPGAARQIARGLAPKITSRMTATLEESAMSALDIPKVQAQEIIPVAIPRIIETQGGKALKNVTAQNVIPMGEKTITRLYNESIESLSKANEQGLTMKGAQALQDATETLQAIPTLTAEQAETILAPYKRLGTELNPIEGQKLLKRLNDELKLFYEKEGVSRSAALANPEIAAKLAFRDSLSNQLDELVKGVSGVDASPYRDIGQVIEFNSNLRNRLSGLEQSEAARKAPIERGRTRVPLSRTQAAAQTAKGATTPFVKTSIERLDKQLGRIFRDAPQELELAPLSEEARDAILTRYAAGNETLTPPIAANIPVPPTLEQQIQDLIESYPPNIRRDPNLARLAAEAELGVR